jgi:high-affinity nickel-transport protein
MTGLIALVFALGLRHGFDPDHLVAIDGLTRSSARVRPGVSRWSGLFFSLGHGAVVTLVGLGVAVAAADLQAPLFSLTGASMAGALFAAMLGIVFTLGMVVTDTLNGWWVARVVAGADRRAAFVSRCVSVAIAFLCLALAAGGFAKYVLPALEEQAAAFGPVLSVASILLIFGVYALASRFAVLR